MSQHGLALPACVRMSASVGRRESARSGLAEVILWCASRGTCLSGPPVGLARRPRLRRCVPVVAPPTTKLGMVLKHESVSIEKSILWSVPKVGFYTCGQTTGRIIVRLGASGAVSSPEPRATSMTSCG
ncbi:hypothetical protein BHE74_00007065 [Ensete ventricosum]|nr:hypothetical protein BHE74_00007065 [Ensete ventricosum]